MSLDRSPASAPLSPAPSAPASPPASPPSSVAFWTYGLAFLGAHLAFMPLLVLLLPRRAEALAGAEAPVFLSFMLLTGGIVAGVAHILAGSLSDRWMARFGNRRGLIAIGAALLFTAYVGFAFAQTKAGLFAALIYFQIALNCCFAPLGVLLADHFPDEFKGRFGGISNAALPASTLLIVPIGWGFPSDDPIAFLIVGAASVACMLPLLMWWQLGDAIEAKGSSRDEPCDAVSLLVRDFSLAWISRLLVQTGAAFAIGYIYLYVTATGIADGVAGDKGASEILGLLSAPAAILAIIATLLGGAFSDAKSLRRAPLCVFALVFAGGMALLAASPAFIWFLIAYGLVQIGLSAFLSVDTALVAQLVGGNPRRGLLLGVMNLSNTLPSIIAPSIALLALAEEDVAGPLSVLFAGFAGAALLAGGLVLLIRSVR